MKIIIEFVDNSIADGGDHAVHGGFRRYIVSGCSKCKRVVLKFQGDRHQSFLCIKLQIINLHVEGKVGEGNVRLDKLLQILVSNLRGSPNS